eukprot:1043277-Ditylum_brightwellii.AAC.1
MHPNVYHQTTTLENPPSPPSTTNDDIAHLSNIIPIENLEFVLMEVAAFLIGELLEQVIQLFPTPTADWLCDDTSIW